MLGHLLRGNKYSGLIVFCNHLGFKVDSRITVNSWTILGTSIGGMLQMNRSCMLTGGKKGKSLGSCTSCYNSSWSLLSTLGIIGFHGIPNACCNGYTTSDT